MPKITVDIPEYLKEWIDKHDISQNALVVNGLRKQYLDEKQIDIKQLIENLFEAKEKLPF